MFYCRHSGDRELAARADVRDRACGVDCVLVEEQEETGEEVGADPADDLQVQSSLNPLEGLQLYYHHVALDENGIALS